MLSKNKLILKAKEGIDKGVDELKKEVARKKAVSRIKKKIMQKEDLRAYRQVARKKARQKYGLGKHEESHESQELFSHGLFGKPVKLPLKKRK